MLMLFRSISSTTLVPRLSSSAFGRPQPPNQVISLFVACFFTSSSSSCGTCWCSSGYSSSRCLQQDKKCQNARVSVWWDFEDCKIPTGVNSFKVAPAITTAIRSSGFLGPIDVTAFGDIIPLSEIKRGALSSAGMRLRHIFRGIPLLKSREVSLFPPESLLTKLMLFRHISLTTLLPRLSSSAAGRLQPRSRVISLFVTRCFTSSSSSGGIGWCSSGYSSSSCLQPDKKLQNVWVSVWWHLDSCNFPADINGLRVVETITATIGTSGILGPIRITAFGDVSQLSRFNREALCSMGVHLKNIFPGEISSSGEVLRRKLMCWVDENPPPVHLFIISSDWDLAKFLHQLRTNGYNILLACKADAPAALRSAATIMWDWCALVKGENVTGRHFNHPPDGPSHPWYVRYRIPLQDPFAVVEQSNSVKTEESPVTALSDATATKLGDEPRGTQDRGRNG